METAVAAVTRIIEEGDGYVPVGYDENGEFGGFDPSRSRGQGVDFDGGGGDDWVEEVIPCRSPSAIGRVIGKGGSAIRVIEEETGTRIQVDKRMLECVVSGPPENVRAAVIKCKQIMQEGFGGAVLRGLGFRADDVDMLIEENRRTALGFFDEGVSTPAKPKKAPEKEPVPVEEAVAEEEPEEEEPVQDEPKSLMEEVGVEETVVQEEPKNATVVAEDPEPEPVVEAPVEKKPGSLEAQRAALSTIAELQREAFFAADAEKPSEVADRLP